jgi:hypothetical protein
MPGERAKRISLLRSLAFYFAASRETLELWLRGTLMRKTILAAAIASVLVLAHSLAEAQSLDPAEQAAIFAAAGFTKRGEQFVRCAEDTAPSYMAGWIELADLNGDGQNEAWVRESSGFCYGATAEAFVLLTKKDGAWVKLLDEVGMALTKDEKHDGWPDIEVGGPGFGPFPVFQWDGAKYKQD